MVVLVTVTHPRLRGSWAERLLWRAPPVEPGAIWVHGASVGEGRAACGLLFDLSTIACNDERA